MKLLTTLMAAAASLAMVGAANAAAPVTGQISVSGFAAAVGSAGFGGATGIDFVTGSGGSTGSAPGTLSSYGSGTGSFAALGNCSTSSCGPIIDLANFSSPVGGFLTVTTGGPVVSFDIASFTEVTHDTTADTLSLVADGIIHFAGFDDTAGQFILSEEGDGVNAFSATVRVGAAPVATPEPATLLILGSSLAALGIIRRKKAC